MSDTPPRTLKIIEEGEQAKLIAGNTKKQKKSKAIADPKKAIAKPKKAIAEEAIAEKPIEENDVVRSGVARKAAPVAESEATPIVIDEPEEDSLEKRIEKDADREILEKKQEEFEKETNFLNELSSDIRGKKPTEGLTAQKAFEIKCSTCKKPKPQGQSWEVHNRSESHIRHLLVDKSDSQVAKLLYRNYQKTFSLNCELCGIWFSDPLTYQAHKLDEDHQSRLKDIFKWRKAALRSDLALSSWDKIGKPKRATPKQLSKALWFATRKGQK